MKAAWRPAQHLALQVACLKKVQKSIPGTSLAAQLVLKKTQEKLSRTLDDCKGAKDESESSSEMEVDSAGPGSAALPAQGTGAAAPTSFVAKAAVLQVKKVRASGRSAWRVKLAVTQPLPGRLTWLAPCLKKAP